MKSQIFIFQPISTHFSWDSLSSEKVSNNYNNMNTCEDCSEVKRCYMFENNYFCDVCIAVRIGVLSSRVHVPSNINKNRELVPVFYECIDTKGNDNEYYRYECDNRFGDDACDFDDDEINRVHFLGYVAPTYDFYRNLNRNVNCKYMCLKCNFVACKKHNDFVLGYCRNCRYESDSDDSDDSDYNGYY